MLNKETVNIILVVIGVGLLFYILSMTSQNVVKNDGIVSANSFVNLGQSSPEGKDIPEQDIRNLEPLGSDDLLPKDQNNVWSEVNPQGQGSLAYRNFIEAGHHVGINTVGSSLRNANLQIRSEPPNPRQVVGPWNQSTVEPDQLRKPMEIGCQ